MGKVTVFAYFAGQLTDKIRDLGYVPGSLLGEALGGSGLLEDIGALTVIEKEPRADAPREGSRIFRTVRYRRRVIATIWYCNELHHATNKNWFVETNEQSAALALGVIKPLADHFDAQANLVVNPKCPLYEMFASDALFYRH